MSKLKRQNLKKCFSLLREFIDESSLHNKKGIAILALNQLQKIAAGRDSVGSFNDGSQANNSRLMCHGRPKAGG